MAEMGNRVVTTAIDLSGLGLDTITETEGEFVIGCMTPLRDLELHQGLHTYTKGAIRESLRHIVGVQFPQLRHCRRKYLGTLRLFLMYSPCFWHLIQRWNFLKAAESVFLIL